jgi:Baseplate J-like protein
MPLTLPNLDDRSYADLVDEGRRLIPTYAPEWTDHNPADPGITLVEVFAFLTEMLLYRANRITEANFQAFLRLINGPDWTPSPQQKLAEELREAVLSLRKPDRAVTCEDFERLAIAAAPAQVARACCVPRRNFDSEDPLARSTDRPGHVSVVIVPQADPVEVSNPQPTTDLIAEVTAYLEPRRLLTTRIHVVGPRYVQVGIQLTMVLKPDAVEDTVRTQAGIALRRFLHPLSGGPEGRGWPFGRNVYVSEIYGMLDSLPGVDYVQKTARGAGAARVVLDELTSAEAGRLIRNDRLELVAVEIRPDELVDVPMEKIDLALVSQRKH